MAGLHVDIELFGDKDLIRKLHKLEEKSQKDIVRKAVRAGSKPILDAFKSNAPQQDPAERTERYEQLRRSGLMPFEILKKSIIRKFKQMRGAYFVVIGPKWPEASHGLWQEKRGPHAGWARRAWDQSATESERKVREKIATEVLRGV